MSKELEFTILPDEQLEQVVGGFTATDDLWVKTAKVNSGNGFIAWEDIWPGVKSK